jgi:3-methylcrotonyl-CoA carboxylase alpha subunit/acetyl-CoA/propionyl-CoA carboxylase biotin carboxyl carrier protein
VPVELRAATGPGETAAVVAVSRADATVRYAERVISVVDAGSAPPRLLLDVDGRRAVAHVEVGRRRVVVAYRGQQWVFERPDAFSGASHTRARDGTVTSPMPGTMLLVGVDAGQDVAAGDVLGVLEAMKMELSLTAPFDGTVAAVHTVAGAQTELGATLFVIEPRERE